MDGKTLGLIIGLSLGVGLIVIAAIVYTIIQLRSKDSGTKYETRNGVDSDVKM